MRLKRYITVQQGLNQISIVALIDGIFLILIFFMLTSSLAFQSGINVKLPKTLTSDTLKNENLIITITSENVIYYKNTVVTINELKEELQQIIFQNQPVLIKADRRSSMGRIVDVWDLCRDLNIERINIATNKEN